MKKVYVAAAFEHRGQVKDLQKKLERLGHIISADWTTHKQVNSMPASQEKHRLAKAYTIEDAEGVESADVFILLLSDRKGTGSHIELGIALGSQIKEIYVVGRNDGSQLFYTHPRIKILPSVDALLVAMT